ncbi:hypothetical protein [Anaerocolumna sp. MB42-C2]|uniref:hypothetical protein n=1 Tax=Anaerocolumna sp. MB42-C2 TaxID=3070997 RepID=UPI0027E0BD94|nr:hypothetical protein [Anaerocolumna sp. MB42-C2]WMJ88903.1 hypothetical protein RBU59_05125 [Anaerocolumna sp. MB42-C2]
MIELNFMEDWKKYLEKEMVILGKLYNQSATIEWNTTNYLNLKRIVISNNKRTIHESKELCVPSKHANDYEEIKKMIRNGNDLYPYLSRKLEKDENFKELMLNDWGITHLHFKRKGTEYVLFTMFTETDAYVIQAMPHGKKYPLVWVNSELLEILHNNWPELIDVYKARMITGDHLEPKEKYVLRYNGVNTLITTKDGSTYYPFGGGICTSGYNIYDVIDTDKIIDTLSKEEDFERSNESDFRKTLKISEEENLTIKLIFEKTGCWLYEPDRKIKFNLFIDNKC